MSAYVIYDGPPAEWPEVVTRLGDGVAGVMRNWERETSMPGSRFAGQRQEDAVAAFVAREVCFELERRLVERHPRAVVDALRTECLPPGVRP